jgi:hypothetical protein
VQEGPGEVQGTPQIIALPDFPKTESANGVKSQRYKLRKMVTESLETEGARS